MALDLKPQEIVSEHAVQQFLFPGKHVECLAIWPGNVPELSDGEIRIALLEHTGQKRQMIVLDEHESRVPVCLFQNRLGEDLIRLSIARPVLQTESRPVESDVAKGPQSFIREAVVILILDPLGQPYPAKRIRRSLGWHTHAIGCVHDLPVRVAASVRYPNTSRSTQYRIDRRSQAACRRHAPNPAGLSGMDVRFAIRYRNEFHAVQTIGHKLVELVPGPTFHGGLPRRLPAQFKRSVLCGLRSIPNTHHHQD